MICCRRSYDLFTKMGWVNLKSTIWIDPNKKIRIQWQEFRNIRIDTFSRFLMPICKIFGHKFVELNYGCCDDLCKDFSYCKRCNKWIKK